MHKATYLFNTNTEKIAQMTVTVLPTDLKLNESGIQLFKYESTKNATKSKISLSKNTISFLRLGTKEVMGDDSSVKLQNQHFLLMKAGNRLMTEVVSDSNKIFQSILLFFSDEEVLLFLEKHKLYLSEIKEQKSIYVFKYDDFTKNFVETLRKLEKLPKAIQTKLLKAKFEELMLYLVYQESAEFLNNLIQNRDSATIKLKTIVENNKHKKLDLEELAFLCNMSISTFKREFFKIYQSTPIKWFNEQRLNHIAFKLKTKRNRPVELYEEAGYENFSNFVQAFKRKFGKTPKQYQMQS